MTKKEQDDFKIIFDKEFYLYFYEDVISEKMTNLQCQLLTNKIVEKKFKILDLPCGHGRHSQKLSEYGCEVTGIDSNSAFIEIAKRNAFQKKLNIDYRLMDMRDIRFEHEFDIVLSLFSSFGFFEDQENNALLKKISSSLKKEGALVLDLKNPDAIIDKIPSEYRLQKGDDFLLDKSSWDSTHKRLIVNRFVCKDRQSQESTFFVRLYDYAEIASLLNQFGLKVVETYGNWHGDAFTKNSDRLIIFAKKSG